MAKRASLDQVLIAKAKTAAIVVATPTAPPLRAIAAVAAVAKSVSAVSAAETAAQFTQSAPMVPSADSVAGQASAASHPNEYGRFLTQLKNKKFPSALHDRADSDRRGLFNEWLTNSQNMSVVAELQISRTLNNSRRSDESSGGLKEWQLMERYRQNAAKVNAIMARCIEEGSFFEDPNVPGDPDEYFYLVLTT